MINKINFGKVEAFELGYGFLRKPVMNVHFFLVDEICIDTAQSLMRKHFLETIREKKINQVILTHFHEDHSGNAAAVQEAKKVPVFGHPITVQKMKAGSSILPYQYFMWGPSEKLDMKPLPPVIESNSISLIPVHTPGHSPDHTSFLEKNEGWLFSGDLYLAPRIKYFRADEKIEETIRSLEKVLELDFQTLFCAHNPQPAEGKKKIREKLEFLKHFCGEVATLHQRGLNEKEIIKNLPYKEVLLVKIMTTGNVSLACMVRSTINALEKKR
ncbi:MAG: MBL fold metallo-hydrolase [Smithella sp.]|nr:MBL fold metallo-hydrolase [Smithella sp.]